MGESLRDLGGILGYIAIGTLIMIWMLGWLGICLLVGQFFDLPEKTTAITGAVLGPLGVVAVVYVGLATQSKEADVIREITNSAYHDQADAGDPFR